MTCDLCGEDEAAFTVKFRPVCAGCVVDALQRELGRQPDGRPGSTMVPVGLFREGPEAA